MVLSPQFRSLNAKATGTDISQHLLDTVFVDDTHTLRRNAQFYKALF